ncbi:MAG TPA: energy-coupling factor ABC transporter ATP-binding protein [Spirochaetia bacterium]|nr:energy-coupling factor ABC transporter ATP-binding protein [Spirochaetales bacterium]HRY81464.1 energy-coupling factor ABC transporter ATP-binding protein [Spirochaetia bacterium]HRZ88911.1 energy-coupling factor ABC transporter ATP-binding protein [Spirochaetia bacterium]
MRSEAILSVRDLGFSYGTREILSIPELDVRAGETLALVGPNGSGKTTLLKLLNDLIRPSSGSILFEGRPAAGDPGLRLRSVYVHQSPFLLAGTVYRNVAYGLRVRRVPEPEIRRRVEASLDLLGLAGFKRRDAKRLSGGETQRIALARALALEPELLLLDEPTAQTDRASGERIRTVLADLATRGGTTIVFSSHDAAFAEALADRAAFLEEGRLVRIEPGRRRYAADLPSQAPESPV